MKVYRGPSSKSFWDGSHQFVARVKPEELEEGVKTQALIQFNISKDALQREAICTAAFEEDDLIPMAAGLLARLRIQQHRLAKIGEIIAEKDTADEQKVLSIRKALADTPQR